MYENKDGKYMVFYDKAAKPIGATSLAFAVGRVEDPAHSRHATVRKVHFHGRWTKA
jgi:hypothetical protein